MKTTPARALFVLTVGCLTLTAAAQPASYLVAGHASDAMHPMRPESKGIAQSASGAIYALVQRSGGTAHVAIWRSTDTGATWTQVGTSLAPGGKASMVFDAAGVILNVLYTETSMAFPRTVFNRFDTTTNLWLSPTDTLLFSGAFYFSADDIERTADDHLLVIAETWQASPSQGLYYRIFDGVAWSPDPAVDTDGTKIDSTYLSGIHAAIILDRSLPRASSEALIFYRSGTGSYGRVMAKLNLGTLALSPEEPLSGEGAGFLAGSSNDRTANLQSVLRLPSGDVYMAFTANNVSNSMPRVRMGHRVPAGTWTFHDVTSASNYQHGNADFNDVAVALVDGSVAVYYGKNTYTGSLSAQNGSGVFRRIWDATAMSFGPEVQLAVTGQNGTFGFLCVPRDPIAGVREFFLYKDNTTDQDVHAYVDPFALAVRTVSSSETSVFPGQTGVPVSVTLENTGANPLGSLIPTLAFHDAAMVDRSAEYSVAAAPGNPTMIAAGATVQLDFMVDVLPGATAGAITVDAGAAAVDSVTMQALVDPNADTTHVWTVLACGYGVCGDCDGNLRVDILDALRAAQIAAAIVAAPAFGSPAFNACNSNGLAFPDPGAVIAILDALELAQAAAGLITLTCC